MKHLLLALAIIATAPAFAQDRPMGWNGDMKISNPAEWESFFALGQVLNGYAVFKQFHSFTRREAGFVVIKLSALSVVRQGLPLNELQSFSKKQVSCLKFLKHSVAHDTRGFPINVYEFTPTKCLEQ